MAVDNPRQNKHGWWGTLTIDEDTKDAEDKSTLKVGTPCVFIKTSKESHYVTSGTFVSKVRVFDNDQQAKDEFRKKSAQNSSRFEEDLKKIGVEYPGAKFTFVEILKVDDVKTSPLVRELNECTRKLFSKESKPKWLDDFKEESGKDDIEAGMSLKYLKDL